MTPLDQLKAWRRATFNERTRLLDAGQGRIEWLDPGTRVSWTEIYTKSRELGIDMNPVALRQAMEQG